MPDLTDQQISTLCDIGAFELNGQTREKQPDVDVLLHGGFIEASADHPGSKYELTAKGAEFLSARGVGLNES